MDNIINKYFKWSCLVMLLVRYNFKNIFHEWEDFKLLIQKVGGTSGLSNINKLNKFSSNNLYKNCALILFHIAQKN